VVPLSSRLLHSLGHDILTSETQPLLLAPMAIVPVIVRELRAQARQPLTHLLRIVGGVSLIAALGVAFCFTCVNSTENFTPSPPGFGQCQQPNPAGQTRHRCRSIAYGRLRNGTVGYGRVTLHRLQTLANRPRGSFHLTTSP